VGHGQQRQLPGGLLRRPPGTDQRSDCGQELTARPAHAEAIPRPNPAVLPHPPGSPAIGKHLEDGLACCVAVAGRIPPPARLVDDLRRATRIGDDRRPPAGERLGHDEYRSPGGVVIRAAVREDGAWEVVDVEYDGEVRLEQLADGRVRVKIGDLRFEYAGTFERRLRLSPI